MITNFNNKITDMNIAEDIKKLKEKIKQETIVLENKNKGLLDEDRENFIILTVRELAEVLEEGQSFTQRRIVELKKEDDIAFIRKDPLLKASSLGFRYVDGFKEKLNYMGTFILSQFNYELKSSVLDLIGKCLKDPSINSIADMDIDLAYQSLIDKYNKSSENYSSINKEVASNFLKIFTSIVTKGQPFDTSLHDRFISPVTLEDVIKGEVVPEPITEEKICTPMNKPVFSEIIKDNTVSLDKHIEEENKSSDKISAEDAVQIISSNINSFKEFSTNLVHIISDVVNNFEAKVDTTELEETKNKLVEVDIELSEYKSIITEKDNIIKEKENIIKELKENIAKSNIDQDEIQDVIGKVENIINAFNGLPDYQKGTSRIKQNLKDDILNAIISLLD